MTASSRPGPSLEEIAPDYLGERFFNDPYPTYARIREIGRPVWSEREGCWFVARYQQIDAVLRSSQVSLRHARERSPIPKAVLFQDPPDHTRQRSVLAAWFTPARIRGFEDRTRVLVERLVDRALERRRMDFVADFAIELPVAVISEILGVPEGLHPELARLSTELFQPGTARGQSRDAARQREAFAALAAIMGGIAADRRRLREGGLLAALAEARDDGGRINEEEFLHTAIVLYSAGHESTAVLLGNTLHSLLAHPGEFDRLRADPSLLPTAIEEVLRFECPVQRPLVRHATATLELEGVTIAPGEGIQILPGAAQRDPEAFPDPDRFDVGRTPNRHLAFGGGIHFCLGAVLTRMETRVGFQTLLERIPGIRRAGGPPSRFRFPWSRPPAPEPVRWKSLQLFRALEALPVEW